VSEPSREPSREQSAPRGREAVKRALLDAGAELFAAHGTAAVSVRDVAARAGVNHGLVHRHFGSKEALRRAVMEGLIERIAAQTSDAPPPRPGEIPAAFAATDETNHYWRMLARSLLDGEDMESIQGGEFPVVTQLRSQVEEAQRRGLMPADLDARTMTALSTALGLGWLLFEPFVLAATGLDECGKDEARKMVFDMWMSAAGTFGKS
jgi:AcrR family transcriptional regulator